MHKNAGKTILLSMIIFLVFLLTGCPNPVNDTSTQDVAAAKEALAVGYSEGDAAASVTANVTLASSGEKEVTITWTSDNAAVGTTGVVTRPKTGESDVTVTLTATLTKNTVSDTKTFTLTVKAIPDTTPPAEVTDIKGTAGDTEVTLSWTNPSDADFAGVKISTDGVTEITVTKENTSKIITGLTNGTSYTFTVKTYDTTGNTSTGTTVTGTPAAPLVPDTTPPAEVTDLYATAGNKEVTLSWTNPTDADFAGVKISAVGITEITVTKENTSKIITGLTNGTSYTFTVKTYDTTGNTSSGRTVNEETPITLALSIGTADPNDLEPYKVEGRYIANQFNEEVLFSNTAFFKASQFETGKSYYVEGAVGVDAINITRDVSKDFNIHSKNVALVMPEGAHLVTIEAPTKSNGIPVAPLDYTPAVGGADADTIVTGTKLLLIRKADGTTFRL